MKMSRSVGLGLVCLNFLTALPAVALERARAAPAQDMVLWYGQPAVEWLEALPLGNGLMGAMVFGGVRQERIALNESSFWSGRPHDYDDPNLEALCFQFGRYLLASSSRAGGQPANLQGIWNESVSPPWGSKYTCLPLAIANDGCCHHPGVVSTWH